MRVLTLLGTTIGAVGGLAAAVVSYQSTSVAADRPEQDPSAVVAVGRPLPAAPPRVRVTTAPCERPAVLRDGVCVTVVTRTVVVTDAPPTVAGSATTTGSATTAPVPESTETTAAETAEPQAQQTTEAQDGVEGETHEPESSEALEPPESDDD